MKRASGSDLNHLLDPMSNEQVSGVENVLCKLLEKSEDNRGPKPQIPVVNIDSENYMLRNMGQESPRSRSLSFNNKNAGGFQELPVFNKMDEKDAKVYKDDLFKFDEKGFKEEDTNMNLDMFCVRETQSSLAQCQTTDTLPSAVVTSLGTTTSTAIAPLAENMIVIGGNCVSIAASISTNCARTMSFHSYFCSCRMSCCCMCGSLCNPDCNACFHNLCVRFTGSYVCQRNADLLQPVTLNQDKVRSIQFYYTTVHDCNVVHLNVYDL